MLDGAMKRYILIGGSVYVLELVVIMIAQGMGASAVLAVAVSFWIGLVTSFILQKIITFKDRRMHHRIVVPQAVAYGLLVLFNFGFTILMTQLLVHLIPAVMARTLVIGTTTIWNFYLYKTRIFKKDEEENPVY